MTDVDRLSYRTLDAYKLSDGRVMVGLNEPNARIPEEYVPARHLRGAVDLLRDVANCSPAFEDRRMGYVEVQIDWQTWDELATYRGQ